MKNLFDAYTLKARVVPAILLLLPSFTTTLACYPNLADSKLFFPLIIALVFLITPMTHVVRTWGKRIEPDLYANWGGMPSVILLRERDQTLESSAKYRYRQFLADQLTNIVMPSPTMEMQNPEFADLQYTQASTWLLTNTRNIQHYPLIHAENINYGFRRNIFASKIPAICLCEATIIFTTVIIFSDWAADHEITNTLPFLNLAFLFLALLTWIFGVTRNWVKDAAYEFARQLITSCDNVALAKPVN